MCHLIAVCLLFPCEGWIRQRWSKKGAKVCAREAPKWSLTAFQSGFDTQQQFPQSLNQAERTVFLLQWEGGQKKR
jgi:hypothetical protein